MHAMVGRQPVKCTREETKGRAVKKKRSNDYLETDQYPRLNRVLYGDPPTSASDSRGSRGSR